MARRCRVRGAASKLVRQSDSRSTLAHLLRIEHARILFTYRIVLSCVGAFCLTAEARRAGAATLSP